MRWFCLELHAGYRCRHAGVCCAAPWQVPAEDVVVQVVRRHALGPGGGGDAFVTTNDGEPPTVARRGDGTCVFYDRDDRRCDIHRAAGADALPSACRHFPREILIDRRGAFVSLSHFCPTAAGLLLDSGGLRIVDAEPPLQINNGPIDGLDATEALAPLVRPGMLSDLEGYGAWERRAIETLDGPAATCREALDQIAAATEKVRSWRPGDGPLAACVEEAFRRPRPAPLRPPVDFAGVAARHFPPESGPVERLGEVRDRLVEPSRAALDRPMRNYVAARLFGNWVAYQGRGLRTTVEWLRICLATLENELARRAEAAERTPGADAVTSAAGAADWLLLHTVDPEALARDLSRVEEDGQGRQDGA